MSTKSKRDEALELAKTVRGEVYEGQKSPSSLLRQCKTICKYLGIVDQNEWIDLELNGYYDKNETVGELLEEIPNYRIVQLTFYTAEGRPCPIPYQILQECAKRPIGEPVSELEESEVLNLVHDPIIDILNKYIYNKIVQKDNFEFQRVRVVRGEISGNLIKRVIEGVKNRITDFLDNIILDLEHDSLKEELESLQKAKTKQKIPNYILIVEGKDDVFVWRGLLWKKGIEPGPSNIRIISGSQGGGFTEAISAIQAVKKLQLQCKIKLVVDSDNKKEAREKKLRDDNIGSSEYWILQEKEIESYLFDAQAIASVTSEKKDVVEAKMQACKRRGKEQLEELFKILGLSKPDEQTKQFIARALPEIPVEIDTIINEIEKEVS